MLENGYDTDTVGCRGIYKSMFAIASVNTHADPGTRCGQGLKEQEKIFINSSDFCHLFLEFWKYKSNKRTARNKIQII